MDKHYFTFGVNHPNRNRHQIIYASYPDTAAEKMHEIHGRDWAFQYTEKEWWRARIDGFFEENLPLEEIYYCEEEE